MTSWKQETLKETPWLSLMKLSSPDFEYIYSHETRCNGRIVAVLPYALPMGATSPKECGMDVLLRAETTPCWGPDQKISAITGGLENAHLMLPLEVLVQETVIHELKEEAGLEATCQELISLGTCRGTKSSDTTFHLFALDASRKTRDTTPHGDGSYLETLAECFWADESKVLEADDPLLPVMLLRLRALKGW